MMDKEPQAIRINIVGENDYSYIGPFVGFEEAARFGELACNPDLEAFEVMDFDDCPKGVRVPTPESVDLVDKNLAGGAFGTQPSV